ncbi:hypothetical protein C9890_0201 [Perkinsus sp. BL_2016]|nr:hypothetical protein C9890_0201 [Perkinsus sp. BL_2016]
MKQGVLWTGVIKARVWADIYIVHEGKQVEVKQAELHVWDSGRDITLSKKFMQEHGIADLRGLRGDDEAIERRATVTPSWLQSEKNQPQSVLNNLSAHLQADEADTGVSMGGALARHGFQGETATSAAGATREKVAAHGTTHSRRDAWTREKAEALHKQLREQMDSRIPALHEALQSVADEFPAAFGEDVSTPCDFKRFKVRLKTGASYICMLPRRLSEPMLKVVQEQVATWLQQGVIRKSSSAFAFPLVLVKRNGKVRVCCDFRLLNEMTEPYPYAMPDLHDVLDRLAGKRFYWSVDVSSFFNQIEVDDDSAEYLAFVVPGGDKYEFRRVPFGCKNAPAWAQQQLRENLQGDESTRGLINFIDDITYGSDDIEDSVKKFRALLEFCVKHKLKLKRSKCVLGVPAVKALGFVLNREGKWIDPDRVMSLLKLPAAKGVKELRHLDIGCACVLYQMVYNEATHQEEPRAIAYSARRFSAAERRWCLAERESYSIKMAWERFNGMLAGLQVVVETDHKNHLYMYSASSMKVQRWRMWLQQFDYEIRHLPGKLNEPVDSLSRLFESLHVSNLMIDAPTVEQARLERQQGIIAPSTLLAGLTKEGTAPPCDDGDCMEGVDGDGGLDEALFNACGAAIAMPDYRVDCAHLNNTEGSERQGDVSLEAAEVAVWEEVDEAEEDEAILGVHQGLQPPEISTDWELKYGLGFKLLKAAGWTLGEWIGRTCPAINEPSEAANGGREPGDFRGIGSAGTAPPTEHHRAGNEERVDFLQSFRRVHNSKVGHVGKVRTYSRLRRLPGFPWGLKTADLFEKVKRECEGCLLCRKVWATRGEIEGAGAAVIRQRPWTEAAIDLIVLDEPDEDGNRNILTVVDSFSRAIELFPIQTGDAQTVAACLYDVYNRYGRPRQVRCDGAKAFVKSVVKRLNRLLGVTLHPVLPYSPYQNGQVERYNQEVMRHLRTIVLGEDEKHVLRVKRWGLHVSAVRRLLNNTINSDTGCTPNELLYGGYGDTEASLFVEELVHEEGEPVAGWKFAKELEDVQLEILCRSEQHQERLMADAVERAVKKGLRRIEEGTYVLCRRGGLGARPKGKLQSRFSGPYLVIERIPEHSNDSVVTCYHLGSKQIVNLHMSELVSIDISQLKMEEAMESASKDEWTYRVIAIEDFKPRGPRREKGKLRPKEEYQFLVKYDLPESKEEDEENPAWQPYSHVRHTYALKEFCSKQEVLRQLGGTFYVSDGDDN